LLSVSGDAVTFTWKDYRPAGQSRQMQLAPCEFVRRFLLHALPKGFVRIRRYGILANCQRETHLVRCRALLGSGKSMAPGQNAPATEPAVVRESPPPRAAPPERRCRACGQGRLRTVEILIPPQGLWSRAPPAPVYS
jgi:hypothetical protein